MSIDTFINHPTLEYMGNVFNYNDRVYIDGHSSKFFFRSHEINPRTGAEWVNVFEENHYLRSFHLDKIKVKNNQKINVLKKHAKIVPTDIICEMHPKYTGRRTPRSGCEICWQGYRDNKL